MIVLLRTLTKKSVIGFGNHRLNTVGDVFIMNRQVDLIKMYFLLGSISFHKDILDELHIPDHLRFEKPGKSPEHLREALKAYFDYRRSITTDLQRIKQWAMQKRQRRILSEKLQMIPCPAVFQGMNHGRLRQS
jgi:hypothetical protein